MTIEPPGSPDIDLTPLVLHGKPGVPITSSPVDSPTTPTSSKKKHKKQKKDKKEIFFFEAPLPSTSDIDEQKLEIIKSPAVEERIETIEYELLPSSTTNDSPQIDRTSEEIKDEFKQLNQILDESQQKLTDIKSDEEYVEPSSTSVISDIEEIRQVDDEKNDSTSSDASQWLSSSFTILPEDNKADTQTTEQTKVTETTTTIPSTDHELIQPDILPISIPTKKKKTKQKSTGQELFRQPEVSSSPLVTEEPKVQSKPLLPTSIKITTTTTVRSKVVTSPEDEEEMEDDEGFQVVSYRKRIPSATGPEKTPPPSSTNTFKQSFSPDVDLKSTASKGRQGSLPSVITPATAAVIQTTTTKTKPKTDKKETMFFNPPLSSPSTDTDIISSSSIDSSRAKHIEQQATDRYRRSSDTTQPKSLFSTVSTSSAGPSLTTGENIKQQPIDEGTILQSQIPSLSLPTLTESNVQSKPVLPPAILRSKSSTSPEEEEDNEGFQVVHHRKRISSVPKSEKSLPPLPPKTSYKQTPSRNSNLKSTVIHGRHGSETRSIPRTTTGVQTSSNKRQQIRPKQDRPQLPPFSSPHSPASQETHIMSLFGAENQKKEQTKQSVSDKGRRISDTILQSSSSIDQTSRQIEQQRPIDIEHRTIIPVVQQKSSDQNRQQKAIETKIEQLSTNVPSPVDRSLQHIVQEYHVPTKDEIKTAIQQTSVKETVPSTVTSTASTITQKSTLTEGDNDDDGFRVVRYRKHTPASTTSTTVSKQQSFGSDTDKKSTNISKKQSPPSSITIPVSTVSQTTTPKKKSIKPKKNKEETVVSHVPSSVDILSTSTTDTDLVSSSLEEFKNQPTNEYTEQVPDSQIITEDVSSPLLEKEVTTTTTYGTITTEINEPVQSTDLTELVQKPSSDTQIELQPIKSTTSSIVASADTSEESSKKPKKKHKRQKREPVGAEMSTPSDEVSSTIETLLTTKTIPSSSSTQAPITDVPLTSSQIEEISDKAIESEETLPTPSNAPTINIEDEQVTTTASKKPAKRRKKKAHTTEKEHEKESVLNSSTTSTTDKDSSSTAATTPVKQTSLQSVIKDRLVSDDDKQESEGLTAQNKKKKSKLTEPTITSESNEQKVTSYPHSRSQPTTSKIVPEKVTDVQFKFKKGGEFTMTSRSSIERSPTEWGTVKFLSEEQDLSQPDKPDSSTKQIISQQLITEKEPIIEQITDLTPNLSTEIKTETSTKSTESSETGGEADLNAYRDQTGRLRRKKPRKHTSSLTKPDDTSVTLEQQVPEENKLDRKSISEHWADVLATPLSNTDDEQKPQTEVVQEEQAFEDEDFSETSSKLDSFLPDYIRQQIKISSSSRSYSLNDDRSKPSSSELSTSISQSRSTYILPPSLSNRSTSTDTSESESRKQLQELFDKDIYSTASSILPSTTTLTESDTVFTSSTSINSINSIRKKKQRPKMLKKDIEAKTLLTHEFDDSPLTITEIQQTSPVTQITEDETKDDESFLSSIHDQFSSIISTMSDSFTSAIASSKQTTTDEQLILQSDEPVPSTEETSIISSTTSSEPTTSTTKKSSTRSPRKRSKRDSGPDYENLTLQSSGDIEQSFVDKKVIPTSIDANQSDLIKVEPHKQQLRQRTSSGRQISNTEEENEQQAILADDEEDEDFASKPTVLHGTGISTNIQTSSESSNEKQDSSSTIASKRKRTKKKSGTEEAESIAQVSDEVKSDTEDTIADQQTTISEQLRSVQGFHSFTPNKYQYNQYEEGPTIPTEQLKSSITETESGDTVLSRGLNLWLKERKEDESTSSSKKEEPSTIGSGLTRIIQNLVIQPIESEDDDDEEEDSWNGPRAKKPTYTTGIRIEKQIHTTNAYNINHPRSTATTPSWLISSSDGNTYQDDPSKFDQDDEEEDSIDDTSDKQTISHTIDTQFSTTEERQVHLNNLADLTFQTTIGNLLSSSSSSLSSTAKWNETSIRSDDNNQQQTSFTEDDVQRCLGEDFYRESLAVNTLPTEQRTITSLDNIVLKPSQLSEDIDDDDDDYNDTNQQNRNNNNNNNKSSINFDEWAYFLERQNNQQMFLSSLSTSSNIEQDLSTSPECSYAQVLDDETLISDADSSNLRDYVQHPFENERQRYGDFSSLNDDTFVHESPTNPPLLSSSPEQQVSHRQKPSEAFQRWRNQSNRDREESNRTSIDNQNDDEIIISHSDGGLSRRVRP
jgi:hypothetical protein